MMEFVNDIANRFRSPILGNFIFSWLVANWKIPYLTFFVSEESLKGTTKLEVVQKVIDNYGAYKWGYLFFIPLGVTCFIIVAMPWMQNWAEMIRLHCLYLLDKYSESKQVEFELIKNQYENVNKEFVRLRNNVTNEMKLNIIRSKVKPNDIFIGKWKVEIFEKDKHMEYTDCSFITDKFVNSSGEVLIIRSILLDNETHMSTSNFHAKIEVAIPGQDIFEYSLNIDSRDLIKLYKRNSNDLIRLNWERAE
jgi:hypothetical protein